MPKKIGTVDRSVLTSAGLPPATSTYTVISHSFVINTVLQALEDNGFEVTEEEYRCTTDAQVAHGTFMINYQGDPDLSLMYTFSNSYDKSLRFTAAIGTKINMNGAYMVSQMDSWLRKHTGTADQEATALINGHIENALAYYNQLKTDKDNMRELTISKSEFGKVLGELFMNDYLAVDQISYIRKEYHKASYPYIDGSNNLWTCYLKIADALRSSHPTKWMNSQVAVHLYFITKYNLTEFDKDESTENDYSTDAITNTTEVNDEEPIIPGILDGVEEVIHLPGFENEQILTIPQPEEEDVLDPAQMSILEKPSIVAAEEANAVLDEIVAEQTNADIKEQSHAEQYEMAVEDDVKAPFAEAITNAAEVNEVYVSISDYPGKEIGDVIQQDDDQYLEITDTWASDDADYYVCKTIEVMEEATEEETPVVEAKDTEPFPLEEATEEDATEMLYGVDNSGGLEITNDPINILAKEEPEVNLDAEEDDDWNKLEEAGVITEATVEDATEEESPADIELSVPDQEVVEEESVKKNVDPIKLAMADDIADIYGYVPDFTYTQAGPDYNVVLETGESIVLNADAINEKVVY
jgi:hypothetical protein